MWPLILTLTLTSTSPNHCRVQQGAELGSPGMLVCAGAPVLRLLEPHRALASRGLITISERDLFNAMNEDILRGEETLAALEECQRRRADLKEMLVRERAAASKALAPTPSLDIWERFRDMGIGALVGAAVVAVVIAVN